MFVCKQKGFSWGKRHFCVIVFSGIFLVSNDIVQTKNNAKVLFIGGA